MSIENTGKKFKVTGKLVTTVLFLLVIYLLFWGMLQSHADISDAFQTGFKGNTDGTAKAISAGLTSAESAMNKSIWKREQFIDVHGLFQRLLGKQLIEEKQVRYYVYKMENGQLTYAYPNYNINWILKQFTQLKETCDEIGTDLLYIQWPYKVDKYNNLLPHGMDDYANKNADKLVRGLEQRGIDTLDYREVLHASEQEYSSMFFQTDHHWTTETAFEAYTYLLSYLNENYGLMYDPMLLDKNNYTFTTLPDSFIGSLANRTGKWYGGIDDFTYVCPNFETDFVWEKYNKAEKKLLTRKGSFEETLFFQSVVADADKAKAYRDNCYFNGNPALVKIKNNLVSTGKILYVCDSYSKPIVSLLSLAVNQIEFMDLRDFSQIDLVDYLRKNEFDQLIVAYSPSALKTSTASQFYVFGPSTAK